MHLLKSEVVELRLVLSASEFRRVAVTCLTPFNIPRSQTVQASCGHHFDTFSPPLIFFGQDKARRGRIASHQMGICQLVRKSHSSAELPLILSQESQGSIKVASILTHNADEQRVRILVSAWLPN